MFIIYFLLLCSFLLFLVSFITNIKSHQYDGRSEGKIVSVNKVSHNGRNSKVYIYYPVYEYTVAGITYQEEFPFGDKCPNNFTVGEETIIKYDKKKPEKFIVSGKENVYLGQAIFGLVMSIIILAVIIAKHLGL